MILFVVELPEEQVILSVPPRCLNINTCSRLFPSLWDKILSPRASLAFVSLFDVQTQRL